MPKRYRHNLRKEAKGGRADGLDVGVVASVDLAVVVWYYHCHGLIVCWGDEGSPRETQGLEDKRREACCLAAGHHRRYGPIVCLLCLIGGGSAGSCDRRSGGLLHHIHLLDLHFLAARFAAPP